MGLVVIVIGILSMEWMNHCSVVLQHMWLLSIYEMDDCSVALRHMLLLKKENGKLLLIFWKVINCGHTGRLGQFVEQVVRLRLDKDIIPSLLRQLEREP